MHKQTYNSTATLQNYSPLGKESVYNFIIQSAEIVTNFFHMKNKLRFFVMCNVSPIPFISE